MALGLPDPRDDSRVDSGKRCRAFGLLAGDSERPGGAEQDGRTVSAAASGNVRRHHLDSGSYLVARDTEGCFVDLTSIEQGRVLAELSDRCSEVSGGRGGDRFPVDPAAGLAVTPTSDTLDHVVADDFERSEIFVAIGDLVEVFLQAGKV
ncbi:hypothetical protein [Bowdeniella massiliensis]|uniref:hypothetical protein n=1 Tax=Bowdeniella massiliensis TaxID=2932264 RepID=UPI002028B8B4|nr:hypothetical protein [Bowdeniella massiliensis]